MSGRYWREKAPELAALAFALIFAAALLAVLEVHPSAIAFLCLVVGLCVLVPMALDWQRRRSFYRDCGQRLAALDRKYLFSELLEEPGFWEGDFFCAALAEVNKSMCDTVADARRDMEEYREYIETWIHEVKTPIASARLTLENHPGPLAGRLEEELFQIEGYVEQALFYARSGAVDRDYAVRAMSLRSAAAGAVKKYARPLIAAGFRVNLGEGDVTVYSDGKWVEFILGQLISNAVKYRREERPELTLTWREEPGAVVLTAADNGAGIPAGDVGRVFVKGFTGRNGRALSTKSTGLGLYLCRKLCCRLGLGIALTSQEGEGTAVSLTFPKSPFHLAGEGEGDKTVTQA